MAWQENQEAITEEVEQIVQTWKQAEGNLVMIFHAIQNHYGYVPRNIAMHLAKELDVPLARIYEVVTFYNFFNLEPPARYTISICTGTACYLKGAPTLVAEFKKQLNINGKYSEDRMFKVQEVRCLGCCGLAPVLNVNGEIIGKVKPKDIDEIITKFKDNQPE